ncbi:MAG TPA: hypothetical protein VF544_20995 [Pyrinomonadaceae bacterium]|jgi:hypothetical protein
MLDPQGGPAECAGDCFGVRFELLRPIRVVVGDLNLAFFGTPDQQPDPSQRSYRLSDPQSFNRYTYASNDPVYRRDPSGLDDTVHPMVCPTCYVVVPISFENGVGSTISGLGDLLGRTIYDELLLPEGLSGQTSSQKSEQVIAPIVNFKKLLQDRLAYGDCADYVAQLINTAAELSGGKNDAISTDVMTLYNMINRQPRGGFFLNQPAIWEGKPVSATAEGILQGNARVTINSKGGFRDDPASISRLPSDYGIAGIQEIIHLAGKNTLYSEELLLRAANALEPNGRPSASTWRSTLFGYSSSKLGQPQPEWNLASAE